MNSLLEIKVMTLITIINNLIIYYMHNGGRMIYAAGFL